MFGWVTLYMDPMRTSVHGNKEEYNTAWMSAASRIMQHANVIEFDIRRNARWLCPTGSVPRAYTPILFLCDWYLDCE